MRRDSGWFACALALTALGFATSRASAAPAPAPAASHRVRVRGITLYYELEGKGPPLLLLHGGAGNGMQFSKQRAEFGKTHRLVVPDSRAQGRSTDRPGPLTYHDMAEDMVALLDTLRLRRVDVMGWSDGGCIGLDLAIHHPERIVHLVTFGANASPDGMRPADRAWADTATAASFGPEMEQGWKALNPEPAHYREAMEKVLELWRTQPRFTTAQLASIRARTLICAGEYDVVLSEHTAMLAATIPHAELWIVPGASHSAMIERPDLVNPRVLGFLGKGPQP
jgi:pimeloyl-ACP methyl ester carboxylesterase